MTYLYWYLGIGALSLAVIFISHQLTKSPADDRIADLLLAADPSSNKWWWKPLNKVIVPILAAIMVLVVWPIAIYWKAKEMIDARNVKQAEPPKEFAVTRDHLLKRLSVGEIETSEIVSDPLEQHLDYHSATSTQHGRLSKNHFRTGINCGRFPLHGHLTGDATRSAAGMSSYAVK